MAGMNFSEDEIDREIERRANFHQANIARLLNVLSYSITKRNEFGSLRPLCIIAAGDSWYDYPLLNNGPGAQDTDIIHQLQHYGMVPPKILNLAHHGDASTDMMSPRKQQRMIHHLQNKANWINGKPDVILISAGGNDVAGDQFADFLEQNDGHSDGINETQFRLVLKRIESSYKTLFDIRDRYATGVPIYAHTYAFAIPDGRHPACVGPWLQPSLFSKGWTSLEDGKRIVRHALTEFRSMLIKLQADKNNIFNVINTHDLIDAEDWANELHPTFLGFRKVVERYHSILKGVHQVMV